MKKMLAFFLIIATLLTCAACGSRKPANVQKPSIYGTLEKQSYKNEALGMGCLMPNGWVFLEQDRMAKIPVEDGETCVMYVTASAREVIRIDFRPMEETQLDSLDLNQYCRDYLSKQDPFWSSETDPVYESYDTISVSISGQSLPGLMRTVTHQDRTVYFAAFAVECDGYVARITVSTFQADRVAQIRSRFYAL